MFSYWMDIYKTRQTLLERLSDRYDENAWSEFIENYRPYIYVVIRRMDIDETDTEDLVQQVLIKLWDKLPEFAYDSNRRFRSYVATICRNKVHDFIRQRTAEVSRDKQKAEEDELRFRVSDLDDIVQKEWELFVSNLALQNIRQSLKQQSVDSFERIMNGEDAASIAQERGLPTNTIQQQFKRVKDRMIEEIKRLKQELE